MRRKSGRKIVCLTFDDGPLPKKTSNIMAVLSDMKITGAGDLLLTGVNWSANEEKATVFKKMLE